MKLNKLILPVACILLAGNVSLAQVIMPWENRTETDGDPFTQSEGDPAQGKFHLEDVIGGRLVQTKGIGAHDVDEGWRTLQPDGTERRDRRHGHCRLPRQR